MKNSVKKLNLQIFLTILVLAVISTHLIDSHHYNNQISNINNQNNINQLNEKSDFQNVLIQAWNTNVNCTYFKYNYDKSACLSSNSTKQALQKIESTNKTLPQGGY